MKDTDQQIRTCYVSFWLFLYHYRNIEKGVDEGVFLELSGQQQYVLLRGEDNSNPVIIYLHGGPSSPDAYCTYSFADGLTDNYTFIAWDQRGCGRTYFKNKKEDLCNETVSFEQAIEDLDDLVDYVCERFDCETVIIMGHSYGTVLGSCYASEYPEKVSAYVGVAQVLSTYEMTKYNYEDAVRQADIAGNDASLMTNTWNRYLKERTIPNVLSVRQETDAYHEAEITGNEIWLSITSPYFGVDDFRWFLKQLGSIDNYIQLNRNLFDVTNDFDIYDSGINLKVPAYYISGSCDWICPVDMVENYVSEKDCDYAEIADCGHNVQYDNPKEFIKAVKGFLEVTRP